MLITPQSHFCMSSPLHPFSIHPPSIHPSSIPHMHEHHAAVVSITTSVSCLKSPRPPLQRLSLHQADLEWIDQPSFVLSSCPGPAQINGHMLGRAPFRAWGKSENPPHPHCQPSSSYFLSISVLWPPPRWGHVRPHIGFVVKTALPLLTYKYTLSDSTFGDKYQSDMLIDQTLHQKTGAGPHKVARGRDWSLSQGGLNPGQDTTPSQGYIGDL